MPLRNVLALVFFLILVGAMVLFAVVFVGKPSSFEKVRGKIADPSLSFHYYSWKTSAHSPHGFSLLLVDNLARLSPNGQSRLYGSYGKNTRHDFLGRRTITCNDNRWFNRALPTAEGPQMVKVSGDYILETWGPNSANLTINGKSFPISSDTVIAIDFSFDGPTVHQFDVDLSVLKDLFVKVAVTSPSSVIEDYIVQSDLILDVLNRPKEEQK